MNLTKIAKGAVRTVKANPTLALLVVGLIAPKLVARAAPIVLAAAAKEEG